MKTKAAPKDRLFQTAARLFYRQGYRAVGVDTLAAESGIGKMTLYREPFDALEVLAELVGVHAGQGACGGRSGLGGWADRHHGVVVGGGVFSDDEDLRARERGV